MINELSDGPVVIKIGGSQQKCYEDVLKQALNIKKLFENNYKVVAVLSAHSGATDKLIKDSNNPWYWIAGEWDAVDYMGGVLKDIGLECITCKQNNGFPLVGDITKPETVKPKLENILKDNTPVLVAGFGLPKGDGSLSLVRNGSDDVAAMLASAINKCNLVYQKDVRGIYYPWPNGSLLREINSSWLFDKISSGEIDKVMSLGAIQVIHNSRLEAHVCNLEYWLNGTFVVNG